QNFDTLSNTAGSTTNNLTIPGWFMTETGGGARDNEQYGVDTGASTTGDTYSYGAAGSTDRALGGLQSGTLIPNFGSCFTNNTGSTITSLAVAFTGEQWRLGTAARTDQLNFEYSTSATDLVTGTWTNVAALNFVTPDTATIGAKNGNGAADRTALSSNISSLGIANGATFWIRWTDINASGADDGLAVDDFSLTPNPVGGLPNLTIDDVTKAEGDTGTTTFTFTVSLSSPAGPSGVTFDIATADGTATSASGDYTQKSLTGQTIASGNSTYTFDVLVNGDTTTEPNETFFVNVTNVTGANVGDGQGLGTINNDDVTLTAIHDIQGSGAASPIAGASVVTRGIVTGVKTNGFFIQEPDATIDADPNTSEGVFVFTSSAPPAAAAVGNFVQVSGTVQEFVPAADLLQPPTTEIITPSTSLLTTGNPLPVPIALSSTFPDPAGTVDQLERLEGMRVSVASLTVVGPTQGTLSEANATSTTNGVFYGVVTGVARPFREPGIPANDPPPPGSSIPPVPRFDANPERIRVDSDALVGGTAIDAGFGAVVTGLVGPLDYAFRTYTIDPDPLPAPVVTGGPVPTAVSLATGQEFTVASYNMERFFDTVDDPGKSDVALTVTAFNNRLSKASLAIRDYLRMPDIIGVEEMENLTTLQTLATKISNDAIAASEPDPQYVAYLVEGNDIGGIDVGFLVKTAPVVGSTPRVTVTTVVQESAGTLFVNPDSSTELLNDRPPLRLMAVINTATGASYPVTVIVNHLRSLSGVNDDSVGSGSNGWATTGQRVRAKRQKQAEDLANLVQARQAADSSERIILIGDFNAFEFNDGLGDSMNVIAGTPVPDNQTAVPGDGVDLVNPDLVNLDNTPPPQERYSYNFDGSAQTLDHLLVNSALIGTTVARRIEHARVDSDFPEVARNNPATPSRLSDHDPLVGFFQVAAFAAADLAVTKTDSPDPVNAGSNLTYTITVMNNGPDAAASASWSDTLPAGTTFVSLPAVAGWACTTPAVGTTGTISCTNPSFAVDSAVFTLTVAVDPAVAAGTVLTNTATATSTTAEGNPGNESGTATTTVAASADLSLTKLDTPDPVNAGTNLTYTITATNAGPSNAASVSLSDTLPAGTTFVSLASPGGWSCTTPAVGVGGTISCSIASLGIGSAVFTLTVAVDPSVAAGTVLSNTATTSSATSDPNPGN
ncbi:MAG: Calx-beta domain-containing protein, partial [Thermoanaerobaculia bacterium]